MYGWLQIALEHVDASGGHEPLAVVRALTILRRLAIHHTDVILPYM